MNLLEAFDKLNRLDEDFENSSWVKRIENLIASGKLDMSTLEDFIQEHEKEENINPKLLDITSKDYNYKSLLQDELLGQDGWTRTDVFNSYAGNTNQLVNELQTKIRALGAEYYVLDSDGSIIIIENGHGLRDWLTRFTSIQEAVEFLIKTPNNIMSNFGYPEITNDEDMEGLCYELDSLNHRYTEAKSSATSKANKCLHDLEDLEEQEYCINDDEYEQMRDEWEQDNYVGSIQRGECTITNVRDIKTKEEFNIEPGQIVYFYTFVQATLDYVYDEDVSEAAALAINSFLAKYDLELINNEITELSWDVIQDLEDPEN